MKILAPVSWDGVNFRFRARSVAPKPGFNFELDEIGASD
jgi:hypothetical protein